jgi:hypothetical protein
VTGTLALRRQRNGQRVCFSGRTSGGEHCGRIYRRFEHTQLGELLICARVRTGPGDSGGPVYTPIQRILGALGATLPAGSFAVPAPP